MDTSNVPAFKPELAWSELSKEDNNTLARGPEEGEFYFVDVDFDSVWAGIILGDRAHSLRVRDLEEGKRVCRQDLDDRFTDMVGRYHRSFTFQ